jgi:tRNA (adenine22-N1)-methyltransferase
MLGQGIPGEDFWDICCDHGLLGESAMLSAQYSRVHFVDRVPHIIASLKVRLGDLPESSRIVLSDAADLEEVIRGTVCIAGVGGHNLIKILSSWTAKDILRARRLVLNPMTHISELRDFLSRWPTYVERETLLVHDRRKEREILVLDAAMSDESGR